ncbi:MAG: translin family protein [Candidatus Saliniplasma sp.]
MKDLDELEEKVKKLDGQLDDKDTVRELALKSSRAIRRLSRKMIKDIHQDNDPQESFNDAIQEVSKLKSIIEGYPELFHSGFLRNGFQELAEAHILWALTSGKELMGADELDITPSAYLLGLADVIGELRRECLEKLTEGDIESAEELLNAMSRIKDMLMELDYPKAIIPIKNKQDMARALVEKTRGDVAISSNREKLREDIDALMKKL